MTDYSTTTGILQPQVEKKGDIWLEFEQKMAADRRLSEAQ